MHVCIDTLICPCKYVWARGHKLSMNTHVVNVWNKLPCREGSKILQLPNIFLWNQHLLLSTLLLYWLFFVFFLHGCRSKCRQPCKPSCQGFTSNVTFEWVLNRKRILVSLTLDKREAFLKQQSSRAWAGHFHTIIPEPELPLVRKDRHQKSQGLATGNVQGRGCSGGRQKLFSEPCDTHTCTFTAAFVASLAKLTTNGHADAW